jgi:hypothetical protein
VSFHASDIRQLAAMRADALRPRALALRLQHQHMRLPWDEPLYRSIHLHAPGFSCIDNSNNKSQVLDIAKILPNFSTARTPPSLSLIAELVQRNLKVIATQGKLAIALSGGMDSALLALCAARAGISTTLISCVFPGLRCDESAAISELSSWLDQPVQRIEMGAQDRFERYQSELFDATDYLPFPAYHTGMRVAKLAHQLGTDIVLDGSGGDELFDWSLLDAVQTAQCWPHWQSLLAGVFRQGGPARRLALRHGVKRLLLGYWRRTINAPLSASGRLLNPGLIRAFYLAGEQINANHGVQLYSPLRDLGLIQALSPYLPWASARSGQRRGLQASLIAMLSDAKIHRRREQKINFDEIAAVPQPPREELVIDLGKAAIENFAGLVPHFLHYQTHIKGRSIDED